MYKYLKKSLFLVGIISFSSLIGPVFAMDNDDIEKIPTGTVLPFAGLREPNGWLICDGRTVSCSNYQRLFNVIGKVYTSKLIISPNNTSQQILGNDTFCIPDLRGRVIVGVDSDNRQNFVTSNRVRSNNKLGESGGEEKHQLTISEMPNHRHGGTLSSSWTGNSTDNYQLNETHKKNMNFTSYEGGDQSHNNMQPYLILNYIIKY